MRVVAFGCSHTFGHGLIDAIINTQNPSKLAWPSHIAKDMNAECVNNGIPGASNKQIWHDVVCLSELKEDDVVFVLWTEIDRHAVIHSDDDIKTIGPWMNTAASKNFYSFVYNDFDANLNLNLYMQSVSNYLQSKGIVNYHHTVGDYTKLPFNTANTLDMLPFKKTLQGLPSAADGEHFGDKAHEVFANNVLEKIDA